MKKSCPHEMYSSLRSQSERLLQAGYPLHVECSVAEALLRKMCMQNNRSQSASTDAHQKVAVMPYIHKLSHNIKKIAGRSKVKMVFSAPQKLIKLCNQRSSRVQRGCKKQHKGSFVACATNVVYSIPLSVLQCPFNTNNPFNSYEVSAYQLALPLSLKVPKQFFKSD